MFEVIFDIETKTFFDETGTKDPADLGVSIVSVYSREFDLENGEIRGEMSSFFEKDIDKMWGKFLNADRIIGFNSNHFDVPALKNYAPSGFNKLPHFDILEHIRDAFGHRASLNSVAKATLGELKVDSGANEVKYFQSGDPESLRKLQYYCEADVMITKKVYDFGYKNGYLNLVDFWNTERKLMVNFRYPNNGQGVLKQTSLF